jgi:isoaspartyl peptidase/L-asparaginase-like protein (Ntn-hydrolase superfamily)
MPDYIAIATWPFGRLAVEKAAAALEKGAAALDAAIAGAKIVEAEKPKIKGDSVGYGGLPNALGTVQLDACVMDGQTLNCGAVAALENVLHPCEVARRVMEKTPHVLLVGEGARMFAIKEGFPLVNLQDPESLAKWIKQREAAARRGREQPPPENHDTVTVLVRDRKGSLGGVCTTSGLADKLPGRVGDSPLIGHGLYVDDSAGAAGGTGVGEEIIRIGGSLTIVEAMRAGKSAQEACELAVRKVNAVAVRRGVHPARVAFLAIDAKGLPGAACTAQTNFEYWIARPGKIEAAKAPEYGPTA